MGITHVLNAAQGPEPSYANTNADYYKADDIKFMGLKGEPDWPVYTGSTGFRG
jgi:hypothetical protein